jgi:hypothetical protein
MYLGFVTWVLWTCAAISISFDAVGMHMVPTCDRSKRNAYAAHHMVNTSTSATKYVVKNLRHAQIYYVIEVVPTELVWERDIQGILCPTSGSKWTQFSHKNLLIVNDYQNVYFTNCSELFARHSISNMQQHNGLSNINTEFISVPWQVTNDVICRETASVEGRTASSIDARRERATAVAASSTVPTKTLKFRYRTH